MRVIHRISESTSNARELMGLLDLYNVPYDANYGLCSFDIGEREEYEQRILELIFEKAIW